MDPLEAVSSVDGRYHRQTQSLSPFSSEGGLIRYRVMVEGEYLIALSGLDGTKLRAFTPDEKRLLRSLYDMPTDEARIVKNIETKGIDGIPATNHDVKAVEYYLRKRLTGTTLEDVLSHIHFGLTSMDIDNVSYALFLSDAIGQVMLPKLYAIENSIDDLARQYAEVPMLARTHGQPATPTTFGKEFKVFETRLWRQLEQLRNRTILVKLNGASGNYNAHRAAYPSVDWTGFTRRFAESFNEDRIIKLEPNLVTTQIEPQDTYAELFQNLGRVNTVFLDFVQDMWRYISDGWIKQRAVAGEIGSSAMPHKVNPIDFENAEGHLGMANALGEFYARKLPVSRLQRDLSDSPVKRSFGIYLAWSLIAYNSLNKGMSKIAVDTDRVVKELEDHPEIIAEAIQTILRREGMQDAYEGMKDLTRGRKVTMDDFGRFIDGLSVDERIKDELKAIKPTNYTGLAKVIASWE
jgi:adenylosuccinate lyase